MKNLLKKILLPLVLCVGFINSAQAGLIENHSLSNVDSNISSNNIQNWFSVNTTNGFDFFTLSFNWRDQGWGNQKGKIFYRLEGFDWLSIDTFAKHSWTSESITVTRKELMTLSTLPRFALASQKTSQPKLEIGFVVGGGGGHKLFVRNAALAITNVPEPSSLALLMLGALGFTAAKRNRK